MNIKIKKLYPTATTPTYGTSGSACFDLYANHSAFIWQNANAPIGTGLAFEIPADHAMLIFPRSGLATQHYINLANCVGVIDSDYRGEVKVVLRNNSVFVHQIEQGDRIAQAMVIPVQQVTFTETNTLTPTKRGEGGFGHTGTK